MSDVATAGTFKVFLTVEEAAARLNIGRTSMFALIKSGAIASVRIGRLRRVPTAEVEDYAARLQAQQCGGPESLTPPVAA